jgi:hypothetical protein
MNIHDAIEQYVDAEFKYGTLDCCLFACNIIRDTTGKDWAAAYRGKYTGVTGAYRLIRKYGTLERMLCHVFGDLHPIWAVKKGDPVLLRTEQVEQDAVGAGVGIYDGTDLVYLTDKGLCRVPILSGRGCFHV